VAFKASDAEFTGDGISVEEEIGDSIFSALRRKLNVLLGSRKNVKKLGVIT
jgi:hypothetical protein